MKKQTKKVTKRETTVTKQKRIALSMLKKAKKPIKSDVFANTLGNTNWDDSTNAGVRRIIRVLVADGHPIASSGEGYFYLRTNAQLHEFQLQQHRKIRAHAIRTDQVLANFACKRA